VTGAVLPATVGSFVDSHVDSLSALESMLWMKDNAQRDVSTLDLARALRMAPHQAAIILDRLADDGVIGAVANDRWRYVGGVGGVDEALTWLREHLGRYRVAVIERIFSKPAGPTEGDR